MELPVSIFRLEVTAVVNHYPIQFDPEEATAVSTETQATQPTVTAVLT
jgi:hypothetical protein